MYYHTSYTVSFEHAVSYLSKQIYTEDHVEGYYTVKWTTIDIGIVYEDIFTIKEMANTSKNWKTL